MGGIDHCLQKPGLQNPPTLPSNALHLAVICGRQQSDSRNKAKNKTVTTCWSAEEILAGAQVVAATCVGAGDSRLAGRTFKLCALDEASQVCFSLRANLQTATCIGLTF